MARKQKAAVAQATRTIDVPDRSVIQEDIAQADNSTQNSAARSLPQAASSDNSLEGYAAINAVAAREEIARRAYELYEQRQREGRDGSPDDDWLRAEAEISPSAQRVGEDASGNIRPR